MTEPYFAVWQTFHICIISEHDLRLSTNPSISMRENVPASLQYTQGMVHCAVHQDIWFELSNINFNCYVLRTNLNWKKGSLHQIFFVSKLFFCCWKQNIQIIQGFLHCMLRHTWESVEIARWYLVSKIPGISDLAPWCFRIGSLATLRL